MFGYNGEIVAVAAISRANHTRNKAYPLYGRGDYEDATGHIVVGSFASIDKQPPGQFTFNAADTQLEVDCIRPSLRSISSLRCQNGVTVSDPVYGDVRFQAGRNMRITSVFDTEAQEVVITFDAMEGEGLSADCVCIDTTDERVIKTINGVQPDTDGNFRFEATECIDITEVAGGIRFEDSCATPCCGSAELTTLVQALETLRNQITTMESKIATLETRTSAMDAAYFASMLGDGGCTEC